MLYKPAFGGLRNVTRAPTENERDVESHTHRAPRHLVWATHGRRPLLSPRFDGVLVEILAKKAAELRCPVLGIGAATDHVYVLARLAPTVRLAELAQRLKGASAFEASRHPRCPRPIVWQRGYWAQSLGIADIADTLDYVRRQRARHDASHPAEAWQHDVESI